jgi:hypothetical protein
MAKAASYTDSGGLWRGRTPNALQGPVQNNHTLSLFVKAVASRVVVPLHHICDTKWSMVAVAASAPPLLGVQLMAEQPRSMVEQQGWV